jgi:hypothetical protein
MSPIIGSSAVTVPAAVAGPLGLTGPTGNTGPSGFSGATGATGFTGATGIYVVSGRPSDRDLIITLSDGRELTIGNLSGVTGASGDAGGLTLGDGYDIFKEVTDGITFWFKGLTSDGTLLIYETDNVVGISGDYVYQGASAGNVTPDKRRFAYLSRHDVYGSSGLTYGYSDSVVGHMIFGHGHTGNRWTYDPEEIIINVEPIESDWVVGITGATEYYFGPTAGMGTGIQFEVRRGSVYKVETPIGIKGFTGNFVDGEVFSFVMQLKGNKLWDWPSNVYFDRSDLFFSCGTDIINFLSTDGGKSWKATIAARGYGTDDCFNVYGVGSCCYTDDDGESNCIDYLSEDECKEYNENFWNPFSTCAENCGKEANGICCNEGGDWGLFASTAICLEEVGPAECDHFGGKFWNYFYYTKDEWGRAEPLNEPVIIGCNMNMFEGDEEGNTGEYECTNLTDDRICLDPCCAPIACCRDGVCIGDSNGGGMGNDPFNPDEKLPPISKIICENVYGGIAIEGICGEVDCCDATIYVGACCREHFECYIDTNHQCFSDGGFFMGPDTDCETVNCCFTDDIGACCLSDGSCQELTMEDCSLSGGIFTDINTSCVSAICEPLIGACCLSSGGCSEITSDECASSGGTFYGVGSCCGNIGV